MKTTTLFSRFNQALVWNSVIFVAQRVGKTLTTFVLAGALSVTEFSAWANILSIVFLLILWCDFGLRRSIPRFLPEFAKNKKTHRQFVTLVLSIQSSVLFILNIILFAATSWLAYRFGLGEYLSAFYLGSCLFFVESVKSLVRLLFHAHFWNRTFNRIETVGVIGATGTIIWSALNGVHGLLHIAIGAEIAAGLLVVASTLVLVPTLLHDPAYQSNRTIDGRKTTKEFLQHTGFMWLMTGATSITERNVLVPFFTLTLGHAAGGLFKVANDLALLIQRFVIRIIGSSGTALLSHVESHLVIEKENRPLWGKAVGHLNKKIILLTVPPLITVIVGLVFVYFLGAHLPHTVWVASFLILLYLAQVLGWIFDHVLEVKRAYKPLFISLFPYGLVALAMVASGYGALVLPMVPMLFVIHGLRFASLGIRILYAYRLFALPAYPWRYGWPRNRCRVW